MFDGLPEGAVFTVTTGPFTGTFQITYQGGTHANDVVLSAVSLTTRFYVADPATMPLLSTDGGNDDISLNGWIIWSAPVNSLTSLTLNGLAGNDTLNVDLSGGNPFPTGGISFDGGDPITSPGDRLVISGGDQGTATYNYSSAHDGNIVMSNYGTVSYTGLESISNNGSATDIVFNLPNGPNAVTLGDDGTSGNQLSQISSPTIATTDFANSGGTLTINPGNAADTLTVNSLPDFNAGLTIGSSDERLNRLTFAGGPNSLAANKSLAAFASGTISLPNLLSSVSASGSGAISLTAARNLFVASGATVSTVNGPLSLSANQQSPATNGDFAGVTINGFVITSGSGAISLAGAGGNDAGTSGHDGVEIDGGAVQSVSGDVGISGTGGSGSGRFNSGVALLNGATVQITGSGRLTMSGTEGIDGDQIGLGLNLAGNVSVVNSSATLIGDTMFLDPENCTLNAATATLRPRTPGLAIDLGPAASGTTSFADSTPVPNSPVTVAFRTFYGGAVANGRNSFCGRAFGICIWAPGHDQQHAAGRSDSDDESGFDGRQPHHNLRAGAESPRYEVRRGRQSNDHARQWYFHRNCQSRPEWAGSAGRFQPQCLGRRHHGHARHESLERK